MSRILVTGAAGFIGSHLCEALLEAGHDVAGIDNFDPFYARAIKERNLAALRDPQGVSLLRRRRRARPAAAGARRSDHPPRRPAGGAAVARTAGGLHGNQRDGDSPPARCGAARGHHARACSGRRPPCTASPPRRRSPRTPWPTSRSPRTPPASAPGSSCAASSRTCTRPGSPASGSSRCTGPASVPTWRSIASPPGSWPARRSRCGATVRASAITRMFRTWWTAFWRPSRGRRRRGGDGAEPWRVFNLGGGGRVRLDRLIALIAAAVGRDAGDRAGARPTGRRIAHGGRSVPVRT